MIIKSNMKRNLLTCLFFSCIATCALAQQQSPERYFDDVFTLIRRGYYRANDIDFRKLRAEAREMIRDAVTTADTYPAIDHVITGLEDKHCHFYPPSTRYGPENDTTPAPRQRQIPFTTAFRDGNTAVIALLSYSEPDARLRREVADSLYAFLCGLRKKNVSRLVIDLRKMEGGSNAPFLCGLGALTGEDLLFTYVDNRDNRYSYRFLHGTLWRETKKARFRELSIWAYREGTIPPLRIAVITGPYTASTGEIITLMLKGLPHCRSFGTATYGLPTGVAIYTLADGARIALATTVPEDRNGHRYTGPISPDEPLPADADEASIFKHIHAYFQP
jgi:hypothetical protein